MSYEFEWPVRWIVGEKALDTLPTELKRLGSKRPMILTDQVLEKLGFLKRIENLLVETQIPCLSFSKIPLESDAQVLTELFDLCHLEKVDALVSLGGGSVLDSGKVLALMLSRGEREPSKLESFEYFHERKVPHICLPTTAGTGSEAGHGAVIKSGHQKLLIAGPALYPHVAILDPSFSQSLPLRLTVATAMDAWTHSWEALSSRQKNPLSSAIARWTLQQIPSSLEVVLKEPRSVSHRLRLAESACLAGLSFSHAMVGLAHSLAHSLAQFCSVSHGEAVGVFLPLSISWTLLQGDFADSIRGEMLGWGLHSDSQLLDWVFNQRNRFCGAVQLARCLEEVSFPKSQVSKLVEGAALDGTWVFIPGKITELTLSRLLEWSFGKSSWSLDEFRTIANADLQSLE